MKKRSILFIFGILSILFILGCETISNLDESRTQTQDAAPEPAKEITQQEEKIFAEPSANTSNNSQSQNDSGTIKIATFNIQVFGTAKAAKKDVVEILKKIVRKFDIVAVQEFRDSSGTVIPFFLNEINSMNGSRFDVVSSERLGRTSSKEQYAFFFNKDKISYKNGTAYVFADVNDSFEREPFVAQFQSGNFDFALANIHTKPEDATREINKLDDVVIDFLSKYPNETDIIVLGDYNADCTYFKENNLTQKFLDAKYFWAVENFADTTTKSTNCTYDRIVFLGNFTGEDFTGRWEVVRFDTEYNLTQNFTEKVSDHYPVWADFWIAKDAD